MSDVEIMEFPYGSFLKLRLEFVLLRDNELEAKIMRIIEGWMIEQKKAWQNECAQAASDGKPEPPEPDYFVTLSYAQIIAQLYMFNSSRKGEGKEVVEGKQNTISRRTVSKATQALIDDKIVFTRPNPNATKEYDAIQYKLNCPLVQEQMKLLPKNPMSYLGSNGRVDGRPCENFAHPPCEKNSHPMRNGFTSPSENSAHGDVKNFHTLIDIENRDTNRMNERGNATDDSTTSNSFLSFTPSFSSLSPQEQLAYFEAEATRLRETMSSQENPKSPTEQSTEISTVVEKQGRGVEQMISHIANGTTPSPEQDPLAHYSPEEREQHEWWCRVALEAKINDTNKKYWRTLSKHIHDFEEFERYFDYVDELIQNDPKATDKRVKPGNLANADNLSGWKQRKKKQEQPSKPKEEKKMTVADLTKRPLSSLTARR